MAKSTVKNPSRLKTIYYLRTVEKKTQVDIAEIMGISVRTVTKVLKIIRLRSGLLDQQAEDLIAFYENELQNLRTRRIGKTDRIYIQYTNLIIELQDKIAGLLKLKNGSTLIDQSHNIQIINYGQTANSREGVQRFNP